MLIDKRFVAWTDRTFKSLAKVLEAVALTAFFAAVGQALDSYISWAAAISL